MGYSFCLAARVLLYASSHRHHERTLLPRSYISLLADIQIHIYTDRQTYRDRTCTMTERGGSERHGVVQRERERERNVLFNDALNTFYLRLYRVRHMVKDHSDSEKGNPLPPHRLLFPISSKGSFICIIPHT